MEARSSETSMTTHNPALCQNPEDIIWSTSAMKTWKSKQERAWVSGHSLLISTSCSFYWCTSMLNQNHILAHQCIKCINLTQALLKILLVCWMNKCGSFTNLRTVDTLTHTVHMALPAFSSLNSQITNKHKHFAQKKQYTPCSMYIFLIRSFILVKNCTKQGWRMLLHNHKDDWLLYEGTRVIF